MTFNVGHVAGGSHAGWKIQKPAPKPWVCVDCDDTRGSLRVIAAYLSRCPDCGTRRP